MLLDGALGDVDPTGDTGVGRTLGHQGQDLALAWRQDVERIPPSTGMHQFVNE